MLSEFIVIIFSILFGWFLRDLQTKAIQKKAKEIKQIIFPQKSEIIDWEVPQTVEQENEKEAKKNMYAE